MQATPENNTAQQSNSADAGLARAADLGCSRLSQKEYFYDVGVGKQAQNRGEISDFCDIFKVNFLNRVKIGQLSLRANFARTQNFAHRP